MPLTILLYALFASVFTISKTALEYSQPFFLVGTRMVIAGSILLAYQYIFYRSSFSIKSSDFWKLLQLGIFCIYLTNALEFWGLQYLSSFKTCFIYSLSPFFSALLCYMLFGEKLSIVKWLSLCIGFLGFIPLLAQQSTGDDFAGAFLFFSWAELAVMLGALSSVYGWILLKQLVHEKGYPPTMANGIGMLLGGIMSLGHSLAVENWTPTPVSETIPFLECTMFLILVSNLICYNLYGYLLKHYSATFMSLAGFTTPFFTALFGWIFLNETVTWPFYVSGVIVFFGLILFYQEELKQAYKVNYATSKIE